MQDRQQDQRAGAGRAGDVVVIDLRGELADLRQQGLAEVVLDAELERAQSRVEVVAALVLDAGRLAQVGEGAARVVLAGAHGRDGAVVLGQFRPEAVALGELYEQVHRLLGE